MKQAKLTRRHLLASTAAASAAATLGFPFVRTSRAAGSLSIGFWDHWVPGANDTLTKLVNEWAEKEKVDVTIDYITSQGNKIILTAAAEAQAGSGHDILAMSTWYPSSYASKLEPVDDVIADLVATNGEVNPVVKYLGRVDDTWIAVPTTPGSQMKPPCIRFDYLKEHAGLDIQQMYPTGKQPNADDWTWDTFLTAAEKCHAAGKSFGLGLGQTTDSVDWVGSLFAAFGAVLVDENGDITVDSDNTRQVLEYAARLTKALPAEVSAWDDASNNKFLVSGQGSLIMNPPSAWAVAKRDAPDVAEKCWYAGTPAGPAGRYGPFLPYFWGIWQFSQNKEAAKSLLRHISTPEATEKLVAASGGYDLPSFAGLTTFDTWATEGPPTGFMYHYPNPYNHQIQHIAAAPAPQAIGVQIYSQATLTKMIVKHAQGDSIDDTIGWATNELEGFMRT